LRVIADHIRSCTFLIVDGVLPGNEGRGYVLRRIIRRAIRHGNKLGATKPFFHKLVATLAAQMGDAYPELRKQQAHAEKALLAEEEQFARTLETACKSWRKRWRVWPALKFPATWCSNSTIPTAFHWT
jgi:alanyl-tRNA synthetase